MLLLVPAVLQGWLAISLFRRKLHMSFRFFFFYTTFASVASLAKFAVQPSYRLYFVTYWATEAAYSILSLFAILEIFPFVFKSFSRAKGFRVVVGAVIFIMVALSAIHAIFDPPIQAGPLIVAIYSLEIGVRYVQGGVFILFVVMSVFYRVPLRRYPFGVAFGFGLLAASRLAAALLRSEFGTRFKFLFTYMPGVVYVLAVLIWLLTFLKPEPPDPLDEVKSPLRPEEVIRRLRDASATLKGRRDDINLLASIHRHLSGPAVPWRAIPSRNSPDNDR